MQPYMMVLAGSKKKMSGPVTCKLEEEREKEKEWSYDIIMPVE